MGHNPIRDQLLVEIRYDHPFTAFFNYFWKLLDSIKFDEAQNDYHPADKFLLL